jgi:hypothetical protein
MFVNRNIFVVTISRKIKFGTVEFILNRKRETILPAIKNVIRIYKKRGFRVTTGQMDNEFEPLRAGLMDEGVELNVTANDEHEPEIEWYIWVVKEQTRSAYNVLPYMKIPTVMIVELVIGCVFWLNNFPIIDGISSTRSPRNIMVGFNLDYQVHCAIEFGSYAQVHEDHDNTMATHTTGAIALRPTGNQQGGYFFMSLTTGQKLNQNHWTELPIPKEVIDHVHVLADKCHNNRVLVFADRNDEVDNLLEENPHDDDDSMAEMIEENLDGDIEINNNDVADQNAGQFVNQYEGNDNDINNEILEDPMEDDINNEVMEDPMED